MNDEKSNSKKEPKRQVVLQKYLLKKYDFRYNVIRNIIEVSSSKKNEYSAMHDHTMWALVNADYGNVTLTYLLQTISFLAVKNKYNPIQYYLDGVKNNYLPDAAEKLSEYIVFHNEEDRKRFVTFFIKWYVGLFKTIFEEDYVHKQTLVFQGPQGIGKTPFCVQILPKKLREYAKFSPQVDLKNKDTKVDLARYILLVIDEIDDFFKSKFNRDSFKTYSTQSKINERLPYAKSDSQFPRIASFLATCNESNFINDPTGSQRFSVFKIKNFKNRKYLNEIGISDSDCIENFDYDGLAAYMYSLYTMKCSPEYTTEENLVNEKVNEEFKHNSSEYETIINHFTPSLKEEEGSEFLTATQICNYLNSRQDNVYFRNYALGKALIRLNFSKCKKNVNNVCVYGYWIKKL